MNTAPFTTLGQTDYVDHLGKPVSASTIQALAPYQHTADGFYHWECGVCKTKHGSRSCGWPIAGQVLVCEGYANTREMDTGRPSIGCGTRNLLVKTNVKELDECFGMKVTLERETADLRLEQDRLQRTIECRVKQRMTDLLSPLKKAWEEQPSQS